jgi:hypothetical protein
MTGEELSDDVETVTESEREDINWTISPKGEMSLELICFIFDID